MLSREIGTSAQLFCVLRTIQNVAHWWRIDAKLMGNEKDVKQRTKERTNKLFKRRADLHLRLDFTEGALKMGRLWFFFQSKLSISSFGSSVMYAHQDAWKFFLKPITRENNGCSCNQGCYKWIDVMSSDLWGHILIKLVCGSNWAKIRTDCAASCKRKSF